MDLLCRLFICLSCSSGLLSQNLDFPTFSNRILKTFATLVLKKYPLEYFDSGVSSLMICLFCPRNDFVGIVDKNYPSALCRCPTGPVIESDTFIGRFCSNKYTCLSNTANIHCFWGEIGTIGWQMEMEKRMLKEKDSKSFLNFRKQLISDLDCVLELFLALQTNVKVLKGWRCINIQKWNSLLSKVLGFLNIIPACAFQIKFQIK